MELEAGGSTYLIQSRIGEGNFGTIYKAVHKITSDKVAIKIEPIRQNLSKKLSLEANILTSLSGAPGFAQIRHHGLEQGNVTLIMELLGDNLQSLFNKCSNKFSFKTVCMLADQAILRLQYLHMKGYIHRDIKPENFVVGIENNANVIYLIDFGLSKKFVHSNGDLFPLTHGNSFVGTPKFGSTNAHAGISQSRRDDLESLAYTLIYFARGSLPWENVSSENPEMLKQVGELKEKISIDELTSGLNPVFSRFLSEVKSLGYDEEPNYVFLRNLFRNALISNTLLADYKFDWHTYNVLLPAVQSSSENVQKRKRINLAPKRIKTAQTKLAIKKFHSSLGLRASSFVNKRNSLPMI